MYTLTSVVNTFNLYSNVTFCACHVHVMEFYPQCFAGIVHNFKKKYVSSVSVSSIPIIYFRSVSCKCPEDNPERRPCDSMVGRKVALQCDLLVMVPL